MIKKFVRFLFVFVLPVSFVLVLGISYFAMSKLVFPVDLKGKNGKLQSEVSKQIRTNLLKKEDTRFVNFVSKDGLKLSGILTKRNNPKANIIVCHGYQSRKEFVADFIDMFSDYNVLIFDFRAHGQSSGKLRTIGCHEYKDVIAAAEFLNSNTKKNKLIPNKLPTIILGSSMGGSAALKAVELEQNICDALILDSSFADLNNVIYNAFKAKSGGLPVIPFVPILKKMVNLLGSCKVEEMKPLESLKKIDKPILFIHSCVDGIVPPNDSLLMYSECLNPKKKIWIGPKCKHAGLRKEFADLYKSKINKFLKLVLS